MVEAGEEVVADNKEEEEEDILCVEDNTAIPMATVHTIAQCETPGTGHQNNATFSNMNGGSTRNCE